ncbi:heparinase [Paenibacillus albidus]|uniref:Heparinase n=1 Tax=Paenibacillus albidus TaxID=2041023 RepID=A0A917C7I7_9BACL|nr:heparinase II/III family protein [Paenibacillus albidus]GGF75906.1 heparinase [Paenibacillus albidus]
MDKTTLLAIISGMEPADLRLYYPDGDQEGFWRKVRESPLYAEEVAEIRAEGERLRTQPVPELTYALFSIFGRTGSRLEYERVYFERRRMLNTYVFLALLEPAEAEPVERLQEILWAICNEYTWCLPAHLGESGIAGTIDLFSAETGFALSEIHCLLGERLPPLLRLRIRQEVGKRLFEPYLTGGPYFWETAEHNWSAVCAGSIGCAALLLASEPSQLADILLKVERSLGYYLKGFGEDGACLEGLGYWNYGFGYFVYYADLADKRSRGRISWFREEKVRNIAKFQQTCFLGGELVANFSDSQPVGQVYLGLSHYVAARFPEVEAPPVSLRAAYTEDHCSRWAPALRNLLWKDTKQAHTEWAMDSYYLPDAQWLLSRCRQGNSTFGFAAKGGHNDEPHNHNDLGQFIIAADGNAYVSDLGSGEYTAGYFGAMRYSYDCNGSQGHSVPIIDGQFQTAGPEAYAVVLEASAGKEKDVLQLDLTQAYRYSGLERFTRSFEWHKEGPVSLTLSDEFSFKEAPGKLVERIVTLCPAVPGEGMVVLKGPDGRDLQIIYDEGLLQPEISEHTFSDHYGAKKTWYGVDFQARACAESVRYTFEFQFSLS